MVCHKENYKRMAVRSLLKKKLNAQEYWLQGQIKTVKLTNKTYEQIWDAKRNYCREYYYPSLQKKIYDTKFNNLTDFRFETKRLMTSKKYWKLQNPNTNVLVRLFKNQLLNEGYDVTKNTYEEIIEKWKSNLW